VIGQILKILDLEIK